MLNTIDYHVCLTHIELGLKIFSPLWHMEQEKEVMAIINNRFDVLYTYYEEKKHNWFRNFGSWFNNKVAAFLLKL